MEENIWENTLQDGILKKEVNNLIWIYGHPLMNLEEAENLAADFYEKITNACYKAENMRGMASKVVNES